LLAAASNHSIHIFKVKRRLWVSMGERLLMFLCFQEAAQWGLKCVLQGHEGLVYSVAWFQDQWLLSASADCLAVVWDVAAETMAWVKSIRGYSQPRKHSKCASKTFRGRLINL
jgi:WD40 repeat protein